MCKIYEVMIYDLTECNKSRTLVRTYVRLVKQVVHTIFFQRTLTYVNESSIA